MPGGEPPFPRDVWICEAYGGAKPGLLAKAAGTAKVSDANANVQQTPL